MMRDDEAHRLVDWAFVAVAEEPSVGFQGRVLRSIEAAGREWAGTRRQRGGRWFRRGIRSRSSIVVVAACVVVVVGATAVFAQTGGFGDAGSELLAAIGLRSGTSTGSRRRPNGVGNRISRR